MSTTVFDDLSAALDQRLNTMSGLPSTAWENAAFTPVNGTLYIRPTILPNTTSQAALGTSGIDEHLGIYQITIFAPAGKGKKEATEMADTLANRFKRGTDLVYNSLEVRLGNVSRSAGRIDGDRYLVTVSIEYMAHIAPR